MKCPKYLSLKWFATLYPVIVEKFYLNVQYVRVRVGAHKFTSVLIVKAKPKNCNAISSNGVFFFVVLKANGNVWNRYNGATHVSEKALKKRNAKICNIFSDTEPCTVHTLQTPKQNTVVQICNKWDSWACAPKLSLNILKNNFLRDNMDVGIRVQQSWQISRDLFNIYSGEMCLGCACVAMFSLKSSKCI